MFNTDTSKLYDQRERRALLVVERTVLLVVEGKVLLDVGKASLLLVMRLPQSANFSCFAVWFDGVIVCVCGY